MRAKPRLPDLKRAARCNCLPARWTSSLYGVRSTSPRAPRPKSLKKVYTCGHLNGVHQPWCSRKIMANLASKAFRRPATPREVERLVALFDGARRRGNSYEESLAVGIQAILISPHRPLPISSWPQRLQEWMVDTAILPRNSRAPPAL